MHLKYFTKRSDNNPTHAVLIAGVSHRGNQKLVKVMRAIQISIVTNSWVVIRWCLSNASQVKPLFWIIRWFLQTTSLNKYLTELMDGLTAKVFRTYNASMTLQEQLNKLTESEDNVNAKVLSYNRANRAVAIRYAYHPVICSFGPLYWNWEEKYKVLGTECISPRRSRMAWSFVSDSERFPSAVWKF